MGTALTGSTVASTYDALLKVTDNGPLGGTAKVITDGMGNDSVLKLGTAGAELTGPLTVDGQIVFPASQNASADANTLDDYEEGTWTPSLGGDATYTAQHGAYTKIGNLVFVRCQVHVDVLGTGSTSTISGLPFTVSNVGGYQASGSVSLYSGLAINVLVLVPSLDNNGTAITFNYATASGASMSTAGAIFGDGARVILSAVYQV